MHLLPLPDEFYAKLFPRSINALAFTNFDGDSNSFDCITIFEIECSNIVTNGRLKLHIIPTSLSSYALRWFNNR